MYGLKEMKVDARNLGMTVDFFQVGGKQKYHKLPHFHPKLLCPGLLESYVSWSQRICVFTPVFEMDKSYNFRPSTTNMFVNFKSEHAEFQPGIISRRLYVLLLKYRERKKRSHCWCTGILL